MLRSDTDPAELTPLHIGLAYWIIQDGNYKDFAAGQSYTFALEFFPYDIAPSTPANENDAPQLQHITGATYEARGRVVLATRSYWVVDFGIPAFQNDEPPSWAQPGVLVSGRVYLGVDPFVYMDELRCEPGMPNLFREWLVRGILAESSPSSEMTHASHRSFVEVRHTGSGFDHYILQCEPGSDW